MTQNHEHEYERGAHMAAAFGIDGRVYACAICGVRKPKPCVVCGATVDVTYDADPFAADVRGDYTEVWECRDCRYESAMDI